MAYHPYIKDTTELVFLPREFRTDPISIHKFETPAINIGGNVTALPAALVERTADRAICLYIVAP